MSPLVTGTGAVTSVGGGSAQVFDALCQGRSGLAPLRGFDPARFRATHAYEIDDRPPHGGDSPERATRWLLQAVAEAVSAAGMSEDLSAVPLLVGTGLRELRSVELRWRDAARFDLDRLHFGPALRARFRATRTYTFANACSASLYALALGSDLISANAADTVVVAGVDTLTESMYGLLDRVQFTAPERLQPFDEARRGTLMGEGAVAVVLRRDHESIRPAALGRLQAVSVNCDAAHPTAPEVQSITEAVHEAHTRAGVGPQDIDLVMLHGTGTQLNDAAEAAAMTDVFGTGDATPVMTAIKGMTGHTSGGSGLLSLVVALHAIASGRIPPTMGLTTPESSAADISFSRDICATRDVRLAQVNAFGFGGVNAVAVVGEVTAR